jgi:hypothetical protein
MNNELHVQLMERYITQLQKLLNESSHTDLDSGRLAYIADKEKADKIINKLNVCVQALM